MQKKSCISLRDLYGFISVMFKREMCVYHSDKPLVILSTCAANS